MSRPTLLAVLALALAGCGVDGAPTRPAPEPAPKPGLHVSGEARIGVISRL